MSLCEEITNASIQENDASEPICNPSTSMDFTVKIRKVGRIRSYTSLLVVGARVRLASITHCWINVLLITLHCAVRCVLPL